MFDQLLGDLRSILFPNADRHPIPVLDGPFKPNTRLEALSALGEPIPACDDIAVDGEAVYVSSGNDILRLSGPQLDRREAYFRGAAEVGALAFGGGRLYAGIAGVGVLAIEDGDEVARLETCDGAPLVCPTAITVLGDGSVIVTQGAARHPPSRWCHDLMERNASGRVIRAGRDLDGARVVAGDLAWPNGACVTADGREFWVSEAWKHRIRGFPVGGGKSRLVVPNLPGYPARLAPAAGGGVWLALFALRTQLVELVLKEDRYRREMMATIDPELWVAPSLRATGGYLEPLQGGSIRKLGIIKPWAPARSYGLVARLSGDGEALESLHSRVGGRHHGITAARIHGDQLLLASKGGGLLLRHDLGGMA